MIAETTRLHEFIFQPPIRQKLSALDKAIEAVQQSIQLNDKSADAHSLLADFYSRKISFGVGMLVSGPALAASI
jgi:hypothetical protein